MSVRSSIVTHNNELLYPPPPLSELDPSSVSKEMKSAPSDASKPESKAVEPAPVTQTVAPTEPSVSNTNNAVNVIGDFGWKQVSISVATVLWIFLLMRATPEAASESTRVFLNHLTVFALSCFIGWQVIWKCISCLTHSIDECNQCDKWNYLGWRYAASTTAANLIQRVFLVDLLCY